MVGVMIFCRNLMGYMDQHGIVLLGQALGPL